MKVTFSSKYSVFAVQAEAGTLVSLTGTPTEVADGIYTVGDSGVVIVNEGTYTDSIYLSTTGSDYTVDRNARIATVVEGVQVWVGSSPLDCPFPKSGKGGGGSGSITIYYTTTALTDNATTNPITVNGESVTVNANEFAIYEKKEFVFDGVHWHEFGVGIDDYTTTERKIGKWIDGSDLYQRTFEVTGIHNDGTYDDNILGTSNIVIRDWTGHIQYDIGDGKQFFPIYGIWLSTNDWIGCWTTTGLADLAIRAKVNTAIYTLEKVVITIKYTKISEQTNTLNANIQQTEEPTDEMR